MKKMDGNPTNKTKQSFRSDFEKLLKLINEKSFIDDVYSSLKDTLTVKAGMRSLSSFRMSIFSGVIYWNRLSGEVTTFLVNNNTIESRTTGTDYLSHIPVLRFTDSLFQESRLLKEYEQEPTSVNEVLDKPEKFKLFLSKKIKTRMTSFYKKYLSAELSGDYNEIISYYSKGEVYPIDLFPIEKQIKLFWNSTELFSFIHGGSVSPYYKINPELLPSNYKISVNSILFEDLRNNKLFDHYEQFSDLIFEVILTRLKQDEPIASGSLKIVLDFSKQYESKNPETVKALLPDKTIFEAILEKQIEDQRAVLFGGLRFFYTTPQCLLDETATSEEVELLQKSMIELVKNSGTLLCAKYYSKLERSMYDLLLEKDVVLVEAFESGTQVKARVLDYGHYPLVYSPISFVEYSSYSLTVHRFPASEDLFADYKEIEDDLQSINAKTTKSTKEICNFFLKFNSAQLREAEIKHLEFVLSMDTID